MSFFTAFEIIGILGLQPVVEKISLHFKPIPSMYGIYTYIWLIFMVNVGKYTIHGCHGKSSPRRIAVLVPFPIAHFPDHFAAQTSWKLEIFWDHLAFWVDEHVMIKKKGEGFFFELSQYFLGGGSIFLIYFHLYLEKMNPFCRACFSVWWVQPRSSFGYRWWFLYFRYLKWLINILGCPILDLFNLIILQIAPWYIILHYHFWEYVWNCFQSSQANPGYSMTWHTEKGVLYARNQSFSVYIVRFWI